jgi:hypothetical protein
MQPRRFAQRPAGADLKPVHRAVDPEETGSQNLTSALPRFSRRSQSRSVNRASTAARFSSRSKGSETLLDTERRKGNAWRDGLFIPPHGLIQALYQLSPEPGGQRRARADHDVANGLETKLNQPILNLWREAQSGYRERRQDLAGPARRNDRHPAMARRRPSPADRIGNTDAGMKRLRLQAGQQIAGKSCLAAEKMRHAVMSKMRPSGG